MLTENIFIMGQPNFDFDRTSTHQSLTNLDYVKGIKCVRSGPRRGVARVRERPYKFSPYIPSNLFSCTVSRKHKSRNLGLFNTSKFYLIKMVFRRRRRTTRRPRRNVRRGPIRRRRRRSRTARLPRRTVRLAGFAFPNSVNTKLRYSETILSTVVSPNTNNPYIFVGNGLFKPDDILAGHQPRGFDELAAIYEKYHVNFSTIEIWAFGLDNADVGDAPLIVLKAGTDTAVELALLGAGINDVYERNRYRKMQVSGNNTGKIIHKLSASSSVTRAWGKMASTGHAEDQNATVLGNPSKKFYWKIWWLNPITGFDPTGVIGPMGFKLNIRITYNVRFYDRKTLNQS